LFFQSEFISIPDLEANVSKLHSCLGKISIVDEDVGSDAVPSTSDLTFGDGSRPDTDDEDNPYVDDWNNAKLLFDAASVMNAEDVMRLETRLKLWYCVDSSFKLD